MATVLCLGAFAQDKAADYTLSPGPPMFSYLDLIVLGKQEMVDSALAAKLHTLLTTTFANNEAYFNGVKPRAEMGAFF